MEISQETKREGQIMISETIHTHFSQGEIPAELLAEVCAVCTLQIEAEKPQDTMYSKIVLASEKTIN